MNLRPAPARIPMPQRMQHAPSHAACARQARNEPIESVAASKAMAADLLTDSQRAGLEQRGRGRRKDLEEETAVWRNLVSEIGAETLATPLS